MRGEDQKITGLDQIDNMIIGMLQKNARMTLSQMAQEAGISRVAVKNRIMQLENRGIIRGYHADIDYGAIPKGIRFTLDIEAEPIFYEEIISTLCASSMLHEIYGTSGKCHIHAAGVAPSSETLGSFTGYLYRTTRGIRDINWQLLTKTYKDMERGVEYVRYQEPEHLEEGGKGNTRI